MQNDLVKKRVGEKWPISFFSDFHFSAYSKWSTGTVCVCFLPIHSGHSTGYKLLSVLSLV